MNTALALPDLSRRLADLPPLPAVLAEVLQAMRHGGLSLERSVALIERDPSVAARCLRLANSPFYGRPGRIGSVSGAATLLGQRTVNQMLTAVTLQQAIRADQCPGFDLNNFWRHAMNVAMAASALSPRLDLDPSEAFLAGLLHDIGELMLVVLVPELLADMDWEAHDDASAAQRERERLGTDHVELGSTVARRWNFPASIVKAIADHHRPWNDDQGSPSLAALLSLIHALTGPLEGGESPDQALARIPATVWSSLRIAPDDRAGLLERLSTSLAAIGQA